jgi:hypothetical protein
MAIALPYDAALDDLRDKMADAFNLDPDAAILEVGGESIGLEGLEFPMGILRKKPGPAILERGSVLKSLRSTFTMECWLIREIEAEEYSLSVLRNLLAAFAVSVEADPHLSDTATDANTVEMEWDGNNQEWPVDTSTGEGLMAGYVAVEVTIEENV